MHRGLLHACAWASATSAAAMLSWFGVRSVLRETGYDPPRALAVSAAADPSPSQPARPPSTPGPGTRPPSTPSGTPATAPPSRTTAPVASQPAGVVRPYALAGGRVVLDLAPSSAALVSATPAAGWQMRVWTQSTWLRVTFTSPSATRAITLLCTWNGHPPDVQTFEDA